MDQYRQVWGNVALRRILGLYFIFSLGYLATWVAILVWAYNFGGPPAASLAGVIQLVPSVAIAPFASQIGDRLRREQALAGGFLVQGLTLIATALTLLAAAPYAAVLVCAALASVALTVGRPIHFALLPDLARSPAELTSSNSLSSLVEGIALFAGPLLAGALLLSSGPGAVFLLFGTLTLLAAPVALRLPVLVRRPAAVGGAGWRSALAGFSVLRHHRGARGFIFVIGIEFVVVGLLEVLTVGLALDVFDMGQSGPGVLAAALGVGGLLGAASSGFLVGKRRLAPAIGLGILIAGIPLMLTGSVDSAHVALILLGVSGAGYSIVDVAGRTLYHRSVPYRLMARVFGLQEALILAANAVGNALAPLFVLVLGHRGAMVAAGLLMPLGGLNAWLLIRRVDASVALPGEGFDLLFAVPMFRVLEQPLLESLARELTPLQVPAGEAVITQGEPGNTFYLIKEGLVSVSRNGAEVNQIGAGDYFGEAALLTDKPRNATVTAITDVELYALERAPFLGAVTASPLSSSEADEVLTERSGDQG